MSWRPQHIYIDLDRTLLDTDTFITAVLSECEAMYGVSQERIRTTMPDFYRHVGNLRYYDFFAHMAALDLDAGRVERDVFAALGGQDFMYPDAHDMLRNLSEANVPLSILSFGKHDLQYFKYRLLPQLAHIPFVSVLYTKKRYIAEAAITPALLIDDLHVYDLPENCRQLVVRRQATHDVQRLDATHTAIRTLQEVENVLKMWYNGINE